MGNLDFLEKKPRIAYTLSWDGISEGKVTNTQGQRKVYKISSGVFTPRPDIVWTPTGSSGVHCNTPENIRLEKNYHFNKNEDVSNVSVYVLKEDTNTAGYYKFDLYFNDSQATLMYVLVANKEILTSDFGNANPIFPEIGWYFAGTSKVEAGDIMSILKDPLVSFSYSGKGFVSPQKPYGYSSRCFNSDDVISIWYNEYEIPDTDEDKSKGFCVLYVPGDWSRKANVKLDKNLADILSAGFNNCLDVNIYDGPNITVNNTPVIGRNFVEVNYTEFNGINGIGVFLVVQNGNHMIPVCFDPSITIEEFYEWRQKYFPSEL